MSAYSRILVCVLCAVLALGARRRGNQNRNAEPERIEVPRVDSLPKQLPTSKLKEAGNAQAVRATAKALERKLLQSCPTCKGRGKITRRGTGGGLHQAETEKCTKCDGTGKIPADSQAIENAMVPVVKAIVAMPIGAVNANAALNEAYAAITDNILKKEGNFKVMQEYGAKILASPKADVDKMVLFKGIYAGEAPHPDRPDEKVQIVRVAHKSQVVAIVSPKQADPPQVTGRALVAGVIAGKVNMNVGAAGNADVVIVERGFIISPNLDDGWWNKE